MSRLSLQKNRVHGKLSKPFNWQHATGLCLSLLVYFRLTRTLFASIDHGNVRGENVNVNGRAHYAFCSRRL